MIIQEMMKTIISTVLDHSTKFRHPTHLVTPSEILMAALSSETFHAIEQKSDEDPNIQDMVVTKDVYNVEVEVKVVCETGDRLLHGDAGTVARTGFKQRRRMALC